MVTTRPETEIAPLRERIAVLKRKLGAVIVAHNYQRPEVQDIADFVGDSLELARKCAEVKAETIIFCGVDFMAETAKILNPSASVHLAHATACCPMAMMIDVEDLREWKARYPQALVVSYVNTTAAIKAESYICCTSANGLKVVEATPSEEVLFVPDKNLGRWISTQTEKKMILYPGYCTTHANLRPEEVLAAKARFPDAKVLVHPEVDIEVAKLADAVLSTSQILRYARESQASTFLIGTEEGIIHRLQKENPGKTFYLLSSSLICPNMKKTRLENVIDVMEHRRNAIEVPEEVRLKAKEALDRMLSIT
ncbi:MAG: quinolinate synthase NadA [Dehalococcoidia bacterium]|nr:quinolinate synthase NadA [Dehalococcoidia bacterium]